MQRRRGRGATRAAECTACALDLRRPSEPHDRRERCLLRRAARWRRLRVHEPAPIPGNVAALEVDGSSCAEAPDPGGEQDLDGFDGLTLAAWVKPDRVNVDSQMLITKYHSAQPINSISYWLLLRGDEIEVFVARQRPIDEARKTSVGLDLTPGEWVHVAGTWDGTRLRIFLDGEEVDGSVQASDGIPTEMDNSGVPVTIGCARAFANGVRSSFLDGTIDDARIYDAALSPAQIRALAEA